MERYKEIERSIIKTYRAKLWAPFIRALKEYELILPGDKVCVCISGGKDSMLLAKLFQELKRHSDFDFDVEYLLMNPGYNEENLNLIKENLKIMNIPAKIIETDIFSVANMQEKSPCYLCAKMRRGALYRLAKELGCNKIALGHHYDDVIETTLMNMLNAGSFQTMLPKLVSDNFPGMELIRPLYLIRERDILAWKNYNQLKFILCACSFTEKTKAEDDPMKSGSQRLATKKLIHDLLEYNSNVEKNIFSAASNVVLDKIIGYKEEGVKHSFLETYKGRRLENEDDKKSLK